MLITSPAARGVTPSRCALLRRCPEEAQKKLRQVAAAVSSKQSCSSCSMLHCCSMHCSLPSNVSVWPQSTAANGKCSARCEDTPKRRAPLRFRFRWLVCLLQPSRRAIQPTRREADPKERRGRRKGWRRRAPKVAAEGRGCPPPRRTASLGAAGAGTLTWPP